MESTEIAQARVVGSEAVATAPMPILVAAAPAPSPSTSGSPADQGLSALIDALREREFALIDSTLLYDSAVDIEGAVRSWFEDLHLEDIRPNTMLAAVRAVGGRLDLSALTSGFGRVNVAGRVQKSERPRVRVQNRTDVSSPPRVKTIPVKSSSPRAPRLPRVRVRWLRVLSAGLSLGLIAIVLVFSPPDLFGKVASKISPMIGDAASAVTPLIGDAANAVGSTIGNVATDVRAAVEERLAAASASPTLARASFDVPPLEAYAASFEQQAPYPTARPNATVEWVIALRNTGSAGWYRGIDGAQASLALADGTVAAVQTTPFVGPGQVGWFVVRFSAPSQPGTHTVALLPRIDGRGALPDLGIHVTVTVSPNP